MDICTTVKVKPWGDDQGDHVLINEVDFDPAVHELFDAPAAASKSAPAKSSPKGTKSAGKKKKR